MRISDWSSDVCSSDRPNKPLADIHGVPMIVHVWRRAMEAGVGPVVVACAEEAIAAAVTAAGGVAVLTDPAHASGSDRIFEALTAVDPGGRHDAVVNLQRSEEHTSELQSLMRISYAVFCLKKKKNNKPENKSDTLQ